MKRAAFWLIVLVAIAAWWHEPRASWRGIPAPSDPVQTSERLPAPFRIRHATVTPLARYAVRAVVLSRDRYRFDATADIAPVDLALGWGPMSVAGVINDLKFSQSGRWYTYRWKGDPPLEPGSIAKHSANTHCLPADDRVRAQLLKVKRHEMVKLEGYLVQVDGDDGGHWRSSLSREDTGGGACEVFWVTQLTRQTLPRASHKK